MTDNPKLAEFVRAARELREVFGVYIESLDELLKGKARDHNVVPRMAFAIKTFDAADAALREEQERK